MKITGRLARRKASIRRFTVGRIATPPQVKVGEAASRKNCCMSTTSRALAATFSRISC